MNEKDKKLICDLLLQADERLKHTMVCDDGVFAMRDARILLKKAYDLVDPKAETKEKEGGT